jgi:hypothetical protein
MCCAAAGERSGLRHNSEANRLLGWVSLWHHDQWMFVNERADWLDVFVWHLVNAAWLGVFVVIMNGWVPGGIGRCPWHG